MATFTVGRHSLVAVVFVCGAAALQASSPKFFQAATQTDFLKGDVENLSIETGNDGRVFRVDPQGNGAPFFDAAELEVHALAPAPNGGLYVASSPDGKIYKVERNGPA